MRSPHTRLAASVGLKRLRADISRAITEPNDCNVTVHMARRQELMRAQVGSRNVYANLGFPHADAMLRKAKIAAEIARIIKRIGCTDRQAAHRLGMSHATRKARG